MQNYFIDAVNKVAQDNVIEDSMHISNNILTININNVTPAHILQLLTHMYKSISATEPCNEYMLVNTKLHDALYWQRFKCKL
jgi:hypothetical protein